MSEAAEKFILAASRSPKPRWRCSFTRPPSALACAAASLTRNPRRPYRYWATQLDQLLNQLNQGWLLRRAPASRARMGMGRSGWVSIQVPFSRRCPIKELMRIP